jgi:hypothetical protein
MADDIENQILREILNNPPLPQRLPRPGDPGLPAMAPPEMRSSLSPQADALMAALGLPASAGPGLNVVTQVGQAPVDQFNRSTDAVAGSWRDVRGSAATCSRKGVSAAIGGVHVVAAETPRP